ncbi:hypothetical protein GcM3_128012 [Golovinomyces cichoracearum]|uniref:Uncharacterized protein n=1 Tax=Golovinomyces cichoracearum TaxID=62708 RepID=A0A420I5E8_9PEZI|nr:hypothetical protein GcM3_128012 [Golovinomyces cichoracearum]
MFHRGSMIGHSRSYDRHRIFAALISASNQGGGMTAKIYRSQISIMSPCAFPRKDFQDRNSIDPTRTEYSKSGTDSSSAEQEKASFDPKVTQPEQSREIAGKGIKGNPLEVSPANPEVSKPVVKTQEERSSSKKEWSR